MRLGLNSYHTINALQLGTYCIDNVGTRHNMSNFIFDKDRKAI